MAALRGICGVPGDALEMDPLKTTTKTNDHAPERRTCAWVCVEAALRRYERRQRLLGVLLWCAALALSACVVAYCVGGMR